MRIRSFCFLISLIASILTFDLAASGEDLNDNELKFTGTIASVEANRDGGGTLLVHFENLELRVLVNSRTDLQDADGDEIEIDGLAVGNSVQVTGRLSPGGILASAVQLRDKADNTFKLRGHITSVQGSDGNLIVSLLGIALVLTPDTKIRWDGADVSLPDASDLETGVNIRAEGTISATTWTATLIKVLPEDSQKERLTFEGTVTAVASDQIKVQVTGPGNVIPVVLNANTKIIGDLRVGSYVEVRGYMNSDFSVTAKRLRVLSLIGITPNKEMKAGETARFTVKLREAYAPNPAAAAAGTNPASNPIANPAANPTAILMNALNAVGGASLLQGIQDFTGTGYITFHWAGEEVQGAATVYAFGPDKFRLDANLPEGVRSLVLTRLAGILKNADGTVRKIPLHNTINLGILSFPHVSLLPVLSDRLTKISLVGTSTVNGRLAYQVRVQRDFPKEFDPVGALTGLCKTDYLVDVTTGLILNSLDMTHPDYTLTDDFTHEIEYQNYLNVKGMILPSLIREKIAGQTTWELRLAEFAFNTGLTDLDFTLGQ